jgi:hypothetical protein
MDKNPDVINAERIIGSLTNTDSRLGARAFKIWGEHRLDPKNNGNGFDPARCVELAKHQLTEEQKTNAKGGV